MDGASSSLALGAALIGVGVLLWREAVPATSWLVGFPADLDAQQVETLLGLVAGMSARARVTSHVEGADGQLRFRLESRRSELVALRSGLQGFAPGVRFDESASEPEPLTDRRFRAFIGWRGTHVLLRRDQPELAVAALLGVLRGARRGERLRFSVELRPVVRPKAPSGSREQHRSRGLLSRTFDPVPDLPADQLRLIRGQYAGPLLGVRIAVEIWAATADRARRLLHQVVAVLRARSGLRGRLSVRSHRFAIRGFGTMLAPPELVALMGWPLVGAEVPGVSYVRSPQLLPDPVVPATAVAGRLFGTSSWPGMERRRLYQPVIGALSHAVIVGPSGAGKSVLLARLMLDDITAGRGALLLDMKGDTALDVLARIPTKRERDVVVLDPSDPRPLPGLRALATDAPELTADLWVGLFRNLFPDSWGVRTERYLRLGVQTLALDRAATITDLPRVFRDVELRRRLVHRANEPLLASSWASFDALSPAQQAEHLAPVLGKVQDVILRRVVRGVLGQTAPKMTIARAMQSGRIVVVRLSPGQLGAPTAQLLGGLVMYEIYQAVMARQGIAPDRRTPYGVFVDEPNVMRHLPIPLDSLYELARGLGVPMATATQSVSQLSLDVQRALLTNAATLATFRAGYADAQLMARELGLTGAQIQHLGQYEIALRLGLRPGLVASVMTARTLPLPEPSSDPEVIRTLAAERYGLALDPPHQDAPAAEPPNELIDAPLGRRRRSR